MSRFLALLLLLGAMLASVPAAAVERMDLRAWGPGDAPPAADPAKAAVDSFLIMGPAGSGAPYRGDFDLWKSGDAAAKTLDPAGSLGWSSTDMTAPEDPHWQLSDYQQDGGDQAAWCGDWFPSCDASDPEGGYGNNWNEAIELRVPVADPSQPVTVHVTASLQVWTEAGYDYVHLACRKNGVSGFWSLQSWDGAIMPTSGPIAVNESVTYQPGEYVDGADIVLEFRVLSDNLYSDEDCSLAAYTAGACQVDDIQVDVIGASTVSYFDDFESGWGNWQVVPTTGVGDFTKLWPMLEDVDLCASNYTWQVAWIDDGLVVPGVGPSECLTWCYGPNGYVVNTTGGALGDGSPLGVHNYAVSPVMDWPAGGLDGLRMDFTVYRHLPMGDPLTLYRFMARSADVDRGQDIASQPWIPAGYWYGGDGEYTRQAWDWSTELEPGRDQVQVAVGVFQAPDLAPYPADATPAPYYDNVRLTAYALGGPVFACDEADLAQDAFPESGTLDLADLGSLSCRFDAARNISPPAHMRNDPGDSIAIDCVAARAGAELLGPPVMHWALQANPVFDAHRSSTPPNPVVGTENGDFWFDLPDTGFLFPGDRLHYYFEATDAVGGADPQTTTLPADLTGFGDFSSNSVWDARFEVNLLPALGVRRPNELRQPGVLLWNDFGDHGDEAMWRLALESFGMVRGYHYDLYRTRQPDAILGNGLGGRATATVLAGYDDLLYSSGDLTAGTLTSGGWPDYTDDVGLLQDWLATGDHGLLIMGDAVASELAGGAGAAFLNDVMGVVFDAADIRPLIGNQTTPLVKAEIGQPVFFQIDEWIAYGGCPKVNAFDAVTAGTGAQRLAYFTDPMGSNVYPYAAAVLNEPDALGYDDRIIYAPYDLSFIYPAPPKSLSYGRYAFMNDVLRYFGWWFPNDVPAEPRFAVRQNAPNPFNPVTTISYTMPRAGHLSLKIYDLRGRLVRTLVDGGVPAGDGDAVWDGADGRGAALPSGVYFYEVRSDAGSQVRKMALVR